MSSLANSLFPFLAENSITNQAKQLIEESRKSVALAERESNYADISFEQTDAESENPNLKLAEISVWHYGQTIKYYSEAVVILEQVGKLELPPKYQKYVELKSKKCLEEMARSNTRKLALGMILRISETV